MTEKTKKYLADVLYAIDLIDSFLGSNKDFLIFQSDLKTKSAVERQLGIIGEAVNQLGKVDNEIIVSNSRQIVDFRNRLIHSYDSLDDSIIWVIVMKHLPVLKEEILNRIAEN